MQSHRSDTVDSYISDKAVMVELALQYGTKTECMPTVGSETLYRSDFSGPEFLEKSNDIKSALRKGLRLEWETAGRDTRAGRRVR
jgi:glucan 1,3-beta-glucosidase